MGNFDQVYGCSICIMGNISVIVKPVREPTPEDICPPVPASSGKARRRPDSHINRGTIDVVDVALNLGLRLQCPDDKNNRERAWLAFLSLDNSDWKASYRI